MGKIKWQAVFFDFDGVILDSVDVKTRAFAALFRQYGPEIEHAVVDYHLANGGVSRFEKFKYYYRHLLQKPITQEELDDLNREFTRLALEGVLAAPYIDGAMETLECLRQHKVPAFVVSGTPHEEMQFIVEHRNLTSYFHEVHGSPREKHEIVKDIASRYSYRLQDCLFVGDAMTDYDAAQACGTDFMGIYSGSNPPFPKGTMLLERVMITENRQ
ncbi:HAD family hydrolase [Desulfurivibrio dismutans]|uniref:HAD family hydrolase n=1 Tax=Desulfurivibrio dismutans TaxID=1398908 RepID=UPI0023DB2D2B|nr:HAD family hydrolase [Desulfurivibrio alkaliphilus]MDF1615684.1 HAD family hydrolase [Desulfurivibrio alkaliphilus]